MSFDSHSLERLRQLGRKLPKEIPEPTNTKKATPRNTSIKKLHPVETEKDPNHLFHELINISDGGNVPIHLIDRLKETEANDKNKKFKNQMKLNNKTDSKDTTLKLKEKYKLENELKDDYILFKQLLLEDDA